MTQIEVPDAEELGGNVTKPFKFVTGTPASSQTASSRRFQSLLTLL